MTIDISTQDTEILQEHAAEWCRQNVSVDNLSDAEQLALEMGRKLSQAMLSAMVEQIDEKKTYQGTSIECECGKDARFMGYRPKWVRTLCGDVRVFRAYYHCKECQRGFSPWDQDQGLTEKIWSPGVKALSAEMCARLTYSEVSSLLDRVLGFGIEESSQQEIVIGIGNRMRAEESARIKGCIDGEDVVAVRESPARLYVSMDAAKAHTGGAWHDIKTGVVFEGKRPQEGSERKSDEMVNARYVAAQETSEEFGRRLYVRALLSGLERAKLVVVIGDGAEWIWNEAKIHFPKCTEILDYFHACEHIHSLARVLYGEGDANGKRWAKTHCDRLKTNGPQSLLKALSRRKPKTEEQKEALRLEMGYFKTHRRRMNYPKYLAKGLMIGSGPVESACKIVVGQRLKQAGMRWSEKGADAILALRTAVLSNETERIQQFARAA
jgi:hypothetical protein